MFLSNYFQRVKIDENTWCIFNSLVMDLLYVSEKELYDIENFHLENDIILNELLKAHIYIKDRKTDDVIYKRLKNYFNNMNDEIDTLYIIPSARCDLKCKYCYIYNNPNNNFYDLEDMSMDVADAICTKYLEYISLKNIKQPFIQFYGGEPTLNWEIIEYISNFFRKYNEDVKLSMITNGNNDFKGYVEFIKKNNIGIGLSIDGPKGLTILNRHEKANTGKYYENILMTLELLKKENVNFAVSLTLTEDVLANQDTVIEWIKNLDVHSVNYNLLQSYNLESHDRMIYSKSATEFILKSYYYLKNVSEDRINRKIRYFAERQFAFSDCSAGYNKQATITNSGEVVVCQCEFLRKDKTIGNILTDSFENIKESINKNNNLKDKSPLLNKTCIRCRAISICGGGCGSKIRGEEIDEGFCQHTLLIFDWLLKEITKSKKIIFCK